MRRLRMFMMALLLVVSLAAARAIYLQGIDASANAQAAANKMTHKNVLKPKRGDLTDRAGIVLAETQPAVNVIADPDMISTNGMDPKRMKDGDKLKAQQAPVAIAATLVKHLGGEASEYLPQLTKAKRDDGSRNMYEVLRKQVPAHTYQQISAELDEGGWYGITKEDNPIRNYPNGVVASNVIGFVDFEGKGAAGFEYGHEAELQGVEGLEIYQSSRYGKIPLGDNTLTPAVNGTNYQLTIDADLQYAAQQELQKAVTGTRAESGTAIILSVKTGEVLAMATTPGYDSNDPGASKPDDLGNRVVSSSYEPGSVQKVLTMAALVDAGLVTTETRVEVPAALPSGDHKITDAWDHDTLYMTTRGVLVKSSNIGTVLLARQLDKARMRSYLAGFGLGSATGVELPGEGTGKLGILPDADMPDYTRDQISFGQGLSVTALQEAAAVAAVANGGVYNQPTVIRSATDADGAAVPVERSEPRRVVSQDASTQVLNMMEGVIAAPEYAKDRTIPGYRVGGKSGTAERVDKRTGRYRGYTASFVTVAPIEDPQLLVYVVLDNPVNGHGGSAVALPPARALTQVALPRYGIAPAAEVPAYDYPLNYQP